MPFDPNDEAGEYKNSISGKNSLYGENFYWVTMIQLIESNDLWHLRAKSCNFIK